MTATLIVREVRWGGGCGRGLDDRVGEGGASGFLGPPRRGSGGKRGRRIPSRSGLRSGRLTQRLECVPYKDEVGGSSPSSPTAPAAARSRACGLPAVKSVPGLDSAKPRGLECAPPVAARVRQPPNQGRSTKDMAQQGGALGDPLPSAHAPAPGAPAAARERVGWRRIAHDLRHRRRRYRQFVGVTFVVWMTLVGRPLEGLLVLGAVLAALGMLVRLWASGYVMKNEVLATVGPYGYVRHPLYVGNVLICAGFCAASGLWWSVPVALVLLLVFYPETIRYEDKKLCRLFP